MTNERRREIEKRWAEIDRKLADLARRFVWGDVNDIVEREQELLGEQDELEYELDIAYLQSGEN